ncbi:tetratricopeptide repeat protein [Solitalea lacus]|uniref:tetratricopeptide repeat protein n=1 Tax=Solitalea lacus TaxID=2911172 RepID=UPI001EDA47E3|nr:tetratricopeptide repeat protein [Solitalea lacus]UKJ09323.1 tetratricopeptide repeat protein [Solitalea lacus]
MFLVAFLLPQLANAQSNPTTDSLIQLLNRTKSTKEKLPITLQLSEELYKSNSTLALKYAFESERLAKKLHSDSLLNKAYINQGTAYLHLGNHPSALNLFFKAIHGAQKNGDSHTLFAAYDNLAILYYYQKDMDNALKYLFAALDQYARKKPMSNFQIERKIYVLNNIGIVYDETKQYKKSAQYFNKALALAKQMNDHEIIANVLTNQADLYNNQGKSELALKQYEEALAIRRKNNNKWGLSKSYLSIGQFYLTNKNYDKAESYIKEAIELGKEAKYWQNVDVASSKLFNLYKLKGDYKNALTALELNKKVNDTLFNQERIRKITQLEMQFEFDRKQADFLTKQKERNIYYWLASIALSLSLVIVTLLFYLQKNRTRKLRLEQENLTQEKSKLEKDVELKEKELANKLLHITQNKEFIDDISTKLIGIKQKIEIEAQSSVQKIISDLQANLQPDLLQEFELRFHQVHDEFFNTLNKKFPDLTPSERKLCAFLKLNMSTKEISTITHQSTKSIEIARTRLRKKLNLTGSDQNLVDFLTQLDV